MLTFREKRYTERLLQEPQGHNSGKLYHWASSLLLALGGAVIVFVCMKTLGNLSAQSIKFVLIPGVVTGMAFLFVGAYGLHISKQIEDRKLLASVLKKLMV